MGLGGREGFVPQTYEWGQEAQVDWFEATVKFGGETRKLQIFAMRSMASGDAFHRAYTHATQQALLEAHEHAFTYFGGVFRTLRYDNMTSVVKKILRGRQRIETDRIIAFRSHWRYQSAYCNPASGHEKGGVEGALGWFRRNCLVPVPEATDLAAFNEQLLELCQQNRQRTVSGHQTPVDEARQYERTLLSPLAKEGYPIVEILDSLVVDSQGRVKVKGNWYSAPVSPGLRVSAAVGPLTVSIQHGGRLVAEHPRGEGQGRQSLNLEHYLAVLERKPGAMAGSTPLAQWRAAGRWSTGLDRLWRQLEERRGKSDGTRAMIMLVSAGLLLGWARLVAAVDEGASSIRSSPRRSSGASTREPEWLTIQRELQRHQDLTLQLIWEEYRINHGEGYSYSRFCELYRVWLNKLDLVLRQEHRAGEKMFVDYAGATRPTAK